MEILKHMLERAQAHPQRIVLPEGDEPRTLEAANIILRDKIANLILIGDPSVINQMAEEKGYEHVLRRKPNYSTHLLTLRCQSMPICSLSFAKPKV